MHCDAVHNGVDQILAAVFVHTGGVEKEDLGVFMQRDPEDAVTCGLRLATDDGQFVADERVKQGAFASIGSTEKCDVSTALRHEGSSFEIGVLGRWLA